MLGAPLPKTWLIMQKGRLQPLLFAYQERNVMEPLNFYTLDNRYVDFLKKAEFEKRGYSRVPNMEYGNFRKPKFLCGIVLNVHGVNYYVPVSSYKKQQSDNFLIIADNGLVTSSLRFNYMFPVPKELLHIRTIENEPDRAYRSLLSQELLYCLKNQIKIQNLAQRTYKRVILGKNPALAVNSCDFILLEKKCVEYCKINNFAIPIKCAELPPKEEFQPEPTPINDFLIQLTKEKAKAKETDKAHERADDPER